ARARAFLYSPAVPGNSFGQRFRITTYGESHGGAVGVVVDGCPAGHPFPAAAIQAQLDRRRPGQSHLTSMRNETDTFELLSGVDPVSGQTLGTPIAMSIRNKDAKSHHYDELAELYRPSHADYTYDARYGLRFVAGGGRASARETAGRVAAGALAEDLLTVSFGITIVAWVESVGEIQAPLPNESQLDRATVDANPVRCPDAAAAAAMEARSDEARGDGDTLGGVIGCAVRGVPAGWGAPVCDKPTADWAAAMMRLPATRGFEIGEGCASTRMRGSQHNDPSEPDPKKDPVGIRSRTNRSGGIQGW